MDKYIDKNGAEITAESIIRFDGDGALERVYATTDPDGREGLGITASRPSYLAAHPYHEPEYYPLTSFAHEAPKVGVVQLTEAAVYRLDGPVWFRETTTKPAGITIPAPLLRIQREWGAKADSNGGGGPTAEGAAMCFTYKDISYMMDPYTIWPFSGSWKPFTDEVTDALAKAGAKEIRYYPGNAKPQ